MGLYDNKFSETEALGATNARKAAELDGFKQASRDEGLAKRGFAAGKDAQANSMASRDAGYGFTIGDVAKMIGEPLEVANNLTDEQLTAYTSQYVADQNNMIDATRGRLPALDVDPGLAAQWKGYR